MKQKILLIGLLTAYTGIVAAQTDSLHKFLFYTNKNQKVDEIYFYDLNKKIVRGKQEVPGPLSICLMNESNIICDTLDHKVLPEFILFGRQGNAYITGSTKFEHILIGDSTFSSGEQFSTLETNVKNVQGMWRILKFDDNLVGLNGLGKKMVVQRVDLKTGLKTILIPSQQFIRIEDQKTVDVTYFLGDNLLIFVVPYQKLFRIALDNFSVVEVPFPSDKDGVWYYFYDHILNKSFAVRHANKMYTLYWFKDDNQLVELTELIGFPKAIVNGHIHFAKRTTEGIMHYMVPINYSARKEREAGNFMLKEVVIKQ